MLWRLSNLGPPLIARLRVLDHLGLALREVAPVHLPTGLTLRW
jgi:hypothetical protein